MKSILLVLVLICAPFLIQSVFASPCCANGGNDDSGVRCDALNTCYGVGFNDGRNATTSADACPAGSFTGPLFVNNTYRQSDTSLCITQFHQTQFPQFSN